MWRILVFISYDCNHLVLSNQTTLAVGSGHTTVVIFFEAIHCDHLQFSTWLLPLYLRIAKDQSSVMISGRWLSYTISTSSASSLSFSNTMTSGKMSPSAPPAPVPSSACKLFYQLKKITLFQTLRLQLFWVHSCPPQSIQAVIDIRIYLVVTITSSASTSSSPPL